MVEATDVDRKQAPGALGMASSERGSTGSGSSRSVTSGLNEGLDTGFQNMYSGVMARPREFEPQAALEQAAHLFWKQGYEETSYDDIVAATKASRYGLYEVFGNKRDLFRKALRKYFDLVAGTYQVELRRADASLPEIRGYFEAVLQAGKDAFQGRGCLLCNTAIEVAPHDQEIAADVRRFFENITKTFRRALENAKSKREIPGDTQVDDWAVGLTGLIQSSALMARVGYPVARIRQNVEATLSGLEKQ